MSLSDRIKIAKRVAKELKEGEIVNLGVGIPTIIPDYLDDKKVYLQSENGLLGMGPTPCDEDIDMDLISASKKPVSMDPGASLFDSSDSFLMIRGGHIDTAVLGALQVDESGEVANWAVPGETILGVGGAMDLVAGARRMIIASMHLSKDGSPKIVKKLSFPSSGTRKADMIVTEHAVFKFLEGKMYLIEMLSDISIEALREMTDAEFHVLEKNKMKTN
ncbi:MULTISPECIES: 3-oxoacid CoA-transferase subunit B [Cytobacillus]|uniref:3-oxoacid CoA-transferase subunit B n=1 Tax=Cytobacillus TaxID=2675230 RepID=UPI00135A6EEF|nr:3-oxoacid CoA-transferase subunit B [Cytobacillus firmus]KAF0819583.1 Succinyl-CoA:3-ketoacid-coenzyme A transferase subunit B [Bacillus sp. ZZV12-4809]MCM3705664.1 3-oxoacid CoA-transferase subunit B [Cytobacillus firmus]